MISARRAASHPDNPTTSRQYDATTLRVRDGRATHCPDELADRFTDLAGTGNRRDAGATTIRSIAGSRAMGGGLAPLFYDEPIAIVRGEGSWLYDGSGQRYLDAYNNVAVVGHAHPTLVQAVSRRLAAAEHALALPAPRCGGAGRTAACDDPEELDTCLFTTSGTEANDLAWRMATD